MKLFRSHNSGAEIFISLGTGCPTGCQSCFKTIAKNTSLPLEKIRYQVEQGHKLSDENFSFFLYGNDVLQNPHILSIIDYIKKLGRKYKIQIPLGSYHEELQEFQELQGTTIFIVSKKINSKQDILSIITSIKEFYSKKDIFINYDLLISDEYKKLLEKILKQQAITEVDGTYSLDIGNLKITLRHLYDINYESKRVEHLQLTSCLVYDSFDIKSDHILMHDHFEIEPSGDITFHNPLCYIGQPKVSNIEKSRSEVLADFSKYKNTFLQPLNNNLEKNCFNCISKGYQY